MADLSCPQEELVFGEEGLVQENEELVDYFDLLPDPIVAVILNKVFDAKSLCSCIAVSKRFASLVPEVESICIKMNPGKLKQPSEDSSKTRNGSKSLVKNFVTKFITKPFNFIQQVVLNGGKSGKGNSSSGFGSGVDVVNWVASALKNFDDVKEIKLELPCYGGEIGINKSVPLLRWEAGFGKEMERCVILGATSVVQRKSKDHGKKKLGSCIELHQGDVENDNVGGGGGGGNNNEEIVFTDEELRLRIIWIISCLIASAGRHNLMKRMVTQCPKLINAVIIDAGKQGKLQMNAEQIKALRESIDSTTHTNRTDSPPSEAGAAASGGGAAGASSSQMGYVGNLVMKLWYVKELELPSSGKVMKGATLVMIKPEIGEEQGKESDGLSLLGGFEGEEAFEEAARELLRRKEKRVYRLEMNAF